MCTGIKLVAANNAVIYARTMEFGYPLASRIITIGPGYIAQSESENSSFSWATEYAVVGANGCGLDTIIDGINEHGLAGGLFYFPDYAQFQEVTRDTSHALAPWQLMTWILTTCKTVQEVTEKLPSVRVTATQFKPWGIIPPVHAIVHDATGDSLVIEYRNGRCMLTKNPLGIFTNAPYFDWHLINLNNYAGLSPYNSPKITHNGLTLSPLGQGSGMRGLPGDFTSPSRFIRAAALTLSTLPAPDADHARKTAFKILETFTIPKGCIRERDTTDTFYEYTQWTSVSDLENKRFYITTYNNPQVQLFSCDAAPATGTLETYEIADQETITTIIKK